MIFILHYLLFGSGQPAIIILMTLYLQTYSDASLTEIGGLLMMLPFISIVMKPLFCALADRHAAHKLYLIISLAIMVLGYGSLVVAPFFPDFIEHHGRIVWYCDILGIIVGFSAFGIIYSLGDALSANAARIKGIPWGSYRVWATVSWGLSGFIVGQINETPLLPKYVPAFLVLVFSGTLEIILISLWPNRRFIMVGDDPNEAKKANTLDSSSSADQTRQQTGDGKDNFSLNGTLRGTARLNPRLMSVMANTLVGEMGESLRSSLGRSSGAKCKRHGLDEILDQHKDLARDSFKTAQVPQAASAGVDLIAAKPIGATSQLESATNASGAAGSKVVDKRKSTLGRAGWLRTERALSRLDSLSSASGFALAQEVKADNNKAAAAATGSIGRSGASRKQLLIMSSLASNNSIGHKAAEQVLRLGANKFDLAQNGINNEPILESSDKSELGSEELSKEEEKKYAEDLQMVLLKLIVKRNPTILKYLLLFTFIGVLFTSHLTFFFMHLEQICAQDGYDFSHIMGIILIAHSLSEVFSFLVIVPHYVPRVGRTGSMLTIIAIFAFRFAFYGTYFVEWSPWWSLVTETGHGFAYGITYSLINEIATEFVDEVDMYLPELIQRGIVSPNMNSGDLKLPLRATMYGLFSGAFDGMGNGIGALGSGMFLDYRSFVDLWLLCAYMSLFIGVAYPLTEWLGKCRAKKYQQKS